MSDYQPKHAKRVGCYLPHGSRRRWCFEATPHYIPLHYIPRHARRS